jgi:uncharacterized protein YukE
MARVVGDPAELRRFARDLNRFSQELEELTSALRGRLNALSKVWRDQEQAKFAEQFEQTMKVLGRFVESSAHHSSMLVRKATSLEEYLNQQ